MCQGSTGILKDPVKQPFGNTLYTSGPGSVVD